MRKTQKFYQNRIIQYCAYGSMLGLGLLSLCLLAPIVPDRISATDNSVYAETRAVVNVAPTVSIAADSSLTTDIIPKSTGSYALSQGRVRVMTNSNNGFSLYLRSGDSSSNQLTSTDASNHATISAATSSATLEQFAANTWGYALSSDPINDATTFAPVPLTNGDAIITTDETTVDVGQGNDYQLAFGVKIDSTLPAGQYTGSVLLSAVANPITVTSLYQLTYMQDMTTDICRNTATEVTKQLVDTRDGNSYWVAKLKDGNCWMTQNLALNLTTAGLKAADTDITTDWNSSSPYPPTATDINQGGSSSVDEPSSTRSWSFNRVVYAVPDARVLCKTPDSDRDVITKIDGTLGNTCAQSGLLDMPSDWKDTFIAQPGTYQYPDGTKFTGLVAVDTNYRTYDAHYLVGNFYNLNAALAGAGVDQAKETNTSICPKNWQLPVGKTNTNTVTVNTDKSIAKLFASYDLPSPKDLAFTLETTEAMISAPFYLVRTGFIDRGWGLIVDFGRNGDWWASNIFNGASSTAYNYFTGGSTTVRQNTTGGGYYGMSVRCVAR